MIYHSAVWLFQYLSFQWWMFRNMQNAISYRKNINLI